MAWIFITLAAAFLQNLRSALQKKLTGDLSLGGATFSRFVFAAPVAILYAGALVALSDMVVSAPPLVFWSFSALGGLSQILGTFLLLASFGYGSFAVGTAFSKTEALQAALFGLIVLGDSVGLIGLGGLVLGVIGVLLLASGGSGGIGAFWTSRRTALFGIASGALFAISAVSYRAAALSLDDGSAFERAAITLAAATTLQTFGMAVWLAWREPGEIGRVLAAWRLTGPTALAGVAASACWFTAMTLQQVAYVRALGQIELVFSTLSSVLVFREKVRPADLAGIALIGGSIVLVLVAAAR